MNELTREQVARQDQADGRCREKLSGGLEWRWGQCAGREGRAAEAGRTQRQKIQQNYSQKNEGIKKFAQFF